MKKGKQRHYIKRYLGFSNFKFDLKLTRCFMLIFLIFFSACLLAGFYEHLQKRFRRDDNPKNIVESLNMN